MNIIACLVLCSSIACGTAAGALDTADLLPSTERISASAYVGQSKSNNEASCRKFVQGFYDWYVKASHKNGGFETAIDKKPRIFSREILRKLREDMAASRKSPGEIVGLDFDPFLNSQDVADRCEAGKVTRKGDRYLVQINSHYSDSKDAGPSLVAELRQESGKWVFVNFHYGKGNGSPKNENLLAVLAELKAERGKKK